MKSILSQPTTVGRRAWNCLSTLLAASLLLGGLTACDTTHQVKETRKDFSGFLGNYADLQPGGSDEANFLYIDHSVNWAKYTKIYIKNVDLWKSDELDSPLGELPPEKQQMLVNFFHTALADALSDHYQIVDQPGPDVLVVHVAITEARKCRPVLNLVSSVVPMALVVSYGKQLITGTGTGVGEVRIEAEFTDGATGQRVAAGVDARAGTKALRTKFDGTWGDAKLAFDWWSTRLNARLQLLQKGDFSTQEL